MTLQILLSRVASSGIKLWLDGEQLAVRAPKGTLTPELRLALAEHKEELMALLRRQAARVLKSPIPRGPESAADPAPLSSGQERLWFLNRLVPDSPLYNLSVRLFIKGALDREALAKAFSALNARHEALRTNFQELDGRPYSVITSASSFDLPSVDLTSLSPAESLQELERLARANRLEPFVLSSQSLLRVLLVSLKKEEHVLLVTQHHIITDAWSVGVLFTELGQLYRAFAANKTPVLPELPIRYADYARWQQAALRGDAAQQSRAWWKEKLAGLPRLELPTARACPAAPTHAGDSRAIAISPELTAQLKELSLREGCTLFVTLLSAWVILLHRYSSQDDFAVGTMTAGRDRSEVQGLLGFFVNTLVLRCDTSGAPTVSALLHRLREVAAAALEHDGVPFDEVVKATRATRGLGLNPLIQAVFLFENLTVPDAEIPGMTWTPQASKADASVEGVTKCDLVLLFMEQNGGLAGSIDYTTDLFDAATIERMVGHLQVLLHAMVEDPQAPISMLPLLPAEERQQLMAWNKTTTHDPQDRCLHEWFEAQAAKSPQAVALCCEQQQLTYQELNERANQLAHHLRSLGVGPEDRVGLCVERSAEVVIGILAILKAGGAYVPLDPMYPKERLAFMLEDSRAKALLTQRWLMAALPDHPVPRLYLDTDWEVIAKEQTGNLTSGAVPENRAYVIYTSGSTGRPKGVEVTHANVARLLAETQHWFHFDASDVWTLFHSYSFDFSVWEIWGALLFGGRLVVVPVEVSRAPDEFHRLLCREQVTVLNQTPSAFRMLVAADESAAPELGPALRLVIFGGEAVDLPSLRPWFQRHGDRRPQLVNMYGITETTVHVTYRRLSEVDLDGESASPIGRPIPDLQVYVLDGNQQLLPIGVPGELYVGGAGVARGYLNRPELTAERFIADPFARTSGARLYKTGDRGRWRADGELEYLGRMDHQVKIRGYRIELGEVECALAQHPAIGEAVVQAREDGPGDRRLVAYLVARHATLPGASELRSYLQDKLPEYMVPAAYVHLPALPLTVNGKVDRQALPAPSQERGADTSASVQTPLEQTVAGIFASVLGLERVDLHEDFFELGGHSLLADAVVGRITQATGMAFSMAEFYRAPTVAAIAQKLAGQQAAAAAPPLEADSVLPVDLRLPAQSATKPVQSVLLTGATGFVGAFVLYELLRAAPLRVHCIVRAADDTAARSRLRAVLEGWELAVDWDRVEVFAGNLSAPQFGLSQALWDELAETTDCIVHGGAAVHHAQGYDSLRATNVGGTIQGLRLAATARAKRLCLVSTLAVTEATPNATEEMPLVPPWKGSGYAQTKWVADRLVLAAAARGQDVKVCRLGLVLGDTARGRVQIGGYWATQALHACARVAAIPEGLELPLHAIPVDLAARSIVAAALEGSTRTVIHIGGAELFATETGAAALREAGVSCESIPLPQWVERVRGAAATDSELKRLLALLDSAATAPFTPVGVSSGEQLLRQLELTQPPLREILVRNLRYLQERGAL